uniref:Attacin C-terminal domain-containing protein n=1 Tax=Dendroctonus ponderosae TaxID=77166 RepID=A0AAR5P431_DENPD
MKTFLFAAFVAISLVLVQAAPTSNNDASNKVAKKRSIGAYEFGSANSLNGDFSTNQGALSGNLALYSSGAAGKFMDVRCKSIKLNIQKQDLKAQLSEFPIVALVIIILNKRGFQS